jgi:hypothetical protein
MTVELRGIHTFDVGHAALKPATVDHPKRVFKHIGSLGQVINEKMGGCIQGGFVIGQSVLKPVSG